jgi:hypothetical protein
MYYKLKKKKKLLKSQAATTYNSRLDDFESDWISQHNNKKHIF